MHRSLSIRAPRLLAAGGAVALVAGVVAAGALPAAAHPTTSATTTKVLTTAVVPGLDKLADLGAVPASKTMTVGITIPGNTAALHAAYLAITTPGSAEYKQYLTPSEIAADFGVDPAVSAAVQKTLEADGLTPVYVAKDDGYVELTGTAAQVEKTFSVSIHDFSVGGKTYYANLTGATVPSAVSAVAGLTSFDDFSLDQRTLAAAAKPAVHRDSTSAATPAADQNTCVEITCTGVVSPDALWSAYDQPNSGVTSGDLGQGQRIAIFGEGDLVQVVKDIRLFEKDTYVDGDTTDTKSVLPSIPVRETLVNDDQSDTSGLGEWDLDSQSSTGMSPDLAELDFYFGQDLTDTSIAGIYSAWVNDADGPAIGNSSFGGCEPLEGLLGEESTDDTLLQMADVEGRTMFTSTGDTGSGGCVVGVDLNGLGNGGAPAIEYPSASPYVVAVGGTVLYTAASANAQTLPATRSLEYAWTFTGGGSADFEPEPADQKALGGSPITQPCVMPLGSICRAVPDVAAMSGDVVTNGYGIESNGAQTETGGTSLSSPLWAGMWARVRAAHATTCTVYPGATTNPGTLGTAQPLLYAVAESSTTTDAASFFDVGGLTDSEPSGNGAYTALPRTPLVDPTGWDFVSGLGVPDVTGLTKALDCGSVTPTSTAVPNSTTVTIAPVSASSCPPNGTATDAVGDETPADTALDIVSTDETSDTSGITFTMTMSGPQETDPAFDDLYDWDFTYLGGNYEVEADNGNLGGGTPTYTLYKLTTTTTGTTSTSLGTLTGSFGAANPLVVTVVMPFATFNTGAKPTTALAPGATLSAISLDTETLAYEEVSYSDTLSFGGCNYDVGGDITTPGTPLAEVPFPALLLGVGGLAAAGAVAMKRRRRA